MEKEREQNYSDRPLKGRIAAGLILVLAGSAIMFRNIGVAPHFINEFILTWQMLLIAVGVVITASSSNRLPGIIIIAVGAAFLLPGIIHNFFRSYHLVWPVLIITGGVILIFSSNRLPEKLFSRTEKTISGDRIDITTIFSGSERRLMSESFAGGSVTTVFGGSEIDLSQCDLAPGISILDISTVFGGTEITIPAGWNVYLDVTPVLGGFTDSRKLEARGGGSDASRSLIIRGAVVFGGGELKSS